MSQTPPPCEERSFLRGTPWTLVGLLGASVIAGTALAAHGDVPPEPVRLLSVTAQHAMLLATAFGWSGGETGVRFSLVLVALVGQGAAAAALHPLGGLAWSAVPVSLWWSATPTQRRALGLRRPPPAALAPGVAAGAFLGGHLLVSASLTLGYRPSIVPVAPILTGVLYDLGVQVLATELFFRGALFNRAQRRWSFPTAAAIATAACLLRYLLDPLLPGRVEIVAGMIFYVSLLSVANAWLFWRYGTIGPPLAAALIFFACYRVLGVT